MLVLLGIGVWSSMFSSGSSFADHYLAGRDMNMPVLLLTLFATQYSGNSLFMNTGNGYEKVGCAALSIGIAVIPPRTSSCRCAGLLLPGDGASHEQRYGPQPHPGTQPCVM